MAVYTLERIQKIPVSLDQAWDFFSDPANLQMITPENMKFKVISQQQGRKMYAGQVIEYYVTPFLNFPLYWMTEITHVEDRKYFVDEQRFGPYTFWHHQHHFKQLDGGLEMTDIVHYKLPLWFLGDLANSLFVERQLSEIFNYRLQKIEALFGKWSE
jgi:ligand-binding SRPBCC domain-containing protein